METGMILTVVRGILEAYLEGRLSLEELTNELETGTPLLQEMFRQRYALRLDAMTEEEFKDALREWLPRTSAPEEWAVIDDQGYTHHFRRGGDGSIIPVD